MSFTRENLVLTSNSTKNGVVPSSYNYYNEDSDTVTTTGYFEDNRLTAGDSINVVSADYTQLTFYRVSAIVTGSTNQATVLSVSINNDIIDDSLSGTTLTVTGLSSLQDVTAKSIAISAINKIVASSATITSVSIYDTSRDSDGGAWRDKTQETSWYNETLNTSTRGATAEFPAMALIVGDTDGITIYDLDDPDVPMWMVLDAGSGSDIGGAAPYRKVIMLNGIMGISKQYDLNTCDFNKDSSIRYSTTGITGYYKGNIEQRNESLGWIINDSLGLIVSRLTNDVAMKVLPNAPIDATTGLPIPTIVVGTEGGISAIYPDGRVYDYGTSESASSKDVNAVDFTDNDELVLSSSSITRLGGLVASDSGPFSGLTNVRAYYSSSTPPLNASGADKLSISAKGDNIVSADSTFLTLIEANETQNSGMVDVITTTFQSGWMPGDIRGAWLANSVTADRCVHANALTENGTVDEDPVDGSAGTSELLSYSGYSATDNQTAASNAEWDVITTGSLTMSIWFKSAGNSAAENYIGFSNVGNTIRYYIRMNSDGTIKGTDDGATAQVAEDSTAAYDDGQWHKVDFVRTSSTLRTLYIDAVSVSTSVTDAGSLTGTGVLPLAIGVLASDGTTGPALTSSLALARITAYAPTQAQITKMYEDEKFLFQEGAQACLSNSDAVSSLSYDDSTDRLIVGTGNGTDIFKGLQRVDTAGSSATSTTVNAVSGQAGMVSVGTAAETVVEAPAIDIIEELNEIKSLNVPTEGVDPMTNLTAPANLDADTVTVAELADIVGNLINKLHDRGVVTQ